MAEKVYLTYCDMGYDGIYILGIASTKDRALEIAALADHLSDADLRVDEYEVNTVMTYGMEKQVFRNE